MTARIFSISILGAVLLAAPSSVRAQQILLPDTAHNIVTEGLDYVYNLQYDKGDQAFEKLKRMYPDHPAGEFLMALNDWWRIKPNIVDDAAVARYRASFDAHLDRTIAMCDERLDEDEFDMVGLFFRGAAFGYRARLKATYNPNTNSINDWISIFRDAQEGRKMLLQAQRLAPGNSDILLGSGLFNYFVDEMPRRYSVLKAVSLPPGDKEIGLKMLRISAARGLYTPVEAKYALVEILTQYEGYNGQKEAVGIAGELHTRYPNNPDFHKYYARNLWHTRKYDQSYTSFESLLRRAKARRAGYELSLVRQALFYMGDIKIRKNDASKAVTILAESVRVNERLSEEDSGYYIASLVRLGNAYDLLGKREMARKQYELALDGDASSDYWEAEAEKGMKKAYSG